MMNNTVFGVFHDRAQAEDAARKLRALGYQQNEISVLMSSKTRSQHFGDSTAEGAGMGAGIGGVLGAIIAGLTATGTIVATGGAAAPLVIGPFAAILAGLGAGGVAGGIIGTLVGAGVPEEQARRYDRAIGEGAIVLAVDAKPENASAVEAILHGQSPSVTTEPPGVMRSSYPPEAIEERADQVIKSRANPID